MDVIFAIQNTKGRSIMKLIAQGLATSGFVPDGELPQGA